MPRANDATAMRERRSPTSADGDAAGAPMLRGRMGTRDLGQRTSVVPRHPRCGVVGDALVVALKRAEVAEDVEVQRFAWSAQRSAARHRGAAAAVLGQHSVCRHSVCQAGSRLGELWLQGGAIEGLQERDHLADVVEIYATNLRIERPHGRVLEAWPIVDIVQE